MSRRRCPEMVSRLKLLLLVWHSIVLFERMLLRQISRRILLHPNLDWQFVCSIDSVSKNTWVLISLMAIFNPHHFHSQPTLLLSLIKFIALSLSLSFSLQFVYFLGMFYLSTFHINTRQIWCLIIIDPNKLIGQTTLFHLGIAYNTCSILGKKCLKSSYHEIVFLT